MQTNIPADIQLSLVLVTYNSSGVIRQALQSIRENLTGVSYEIIVVDNASRDQTPALITNQPQVKAIINEKNVGFGAANNQGFKVARGEFILIFNPDIILPAGFQIQELIQYLRENRQVGLVAPRLFYEDGSLQESVRKFPNPLVQLIRGTFLSRYLSDLPLYRDYLAKDIPRDRPSDVDWVIGAFMLLRKQVLTEIGNFDEDYFMYIEDCDLCMRLHRFNYRVVYYPQSSVTHAYHRESSKKTFSRLKLIHLKSIFTFYRKHYGYYFK